MNRWSTFGTLALCPLLTVPLCAADKDMVGFWRQLIREKGVPGWVKSGLLQVELRDGKLELDDLTFAATGRTVGPRRLYGAKAAGPMWTFRGDYALGPIDFRLKQVDPGVYEGIGFRGKLSAPLRLEKLADTKELIAEYRAVLVELKAEIALSEALIPIFRKAVDDARLRAEIEDIAVRLGIGRGPTTVSMITDIIRTGNLVNEQKRLAELNLKLRRAGEVLSKVEKLEKK